MCHDPRMGRHGAAHTSGRAVRVSIPLIAIGAVVIAAIGFAIWLWSVRSITDPIDGHPVDAYAVVISSPACTSGSGSTVIDLSVNPVVRSSLSACGRRTGERLAVQYLAAHPDQVRLAGTTVARGSALGRWLPVAIVAAGLLAVVATIALTIDRRQSRHAGGRAKVTVAQLRAAADPPVDPMEVGDDHPGKPPPDPATADEPTADVTARIAISGFSDATPRPFRASEILVKDELFTHRGPEAPDR